MRSLFADKFIRVSEINFEKLFLKKRNCYWINEMNKVTNKRSILLRSKGKLSGISENGEYYYCNLVSGRRRKLSQNLN